MALSRFSNFLPCIMNQSMYIINASVLLHSSLPVIARIRIDVAQNVGINQSPIYPINRQINPFIFRFAKIQPPENDSLG